MLSSLLLAPALNIDWIEWDLMGGVGLKLLCLSNGHGEDAIAVRILRELQSLPQAPELAVLPLVGEGYAYRCLPEVPVIGPVKQMPSGGFIYMDGRQLWQDMQGGLVQLTLAQLQVVRAWAKEGGAILAVGDIVPLLFACWSGANYAFVGTAKSEYYLRDEDGPLSRRSWFENLEGWSGSVYLPWERWLMAHKRCKAVFPRDSLTTKTLQQFLIPALDLGNPMMDDLPVENSGPVFYDLDAELKETKRCLKVAILPGSRAPEAYRNWEIILQAVAGVQAIFSDKNPVFLAAIAAGLDLEILSEKLETDGWQRLEKDAESIKLNLFKLNLTDKIIEDSQTVIFTKEKATMVLSKNAFVECLRLADTAIAMAGTATEQFVGLGKPAFSIAGAGPQFTPAFAEAQSRLLGPSIILVESAGEVGQAMRQLFRNPDRLQLINKNGRQRMGEPGAAKRIAKWVIVNWAWGMGHGA